MALIAFNFPIVTHVPFSSGDKAASRRKNTEMEPNDSHGCKIRGLNKIRGTEFLGLRFRVAGLRSELRS